MKSLIEEIKDTQREVLDDPDIDADNKINSIILLEKQIQKLIRADLSANRARWNIIDQLSDLRIYKGK
jgi:hypothetical protein